MLPAQVDEGCRASAQWWTKRAQLARQSGDLAGAELGEAMAAWWLDDAPAWIAGASLPDVPSPEPVPDNTFRARAIRFLNMLCDPESYGHGVNSEIRSVAREIAGVECSAYG